MVAPLFFLISGPVASLGSAISKFNITIANALIDTTLMCLQLANGQQLNVLLLEEETAELQAKRSAADKLRIWSRRTFGIMMSAALQALAGYGIVQLTITSSVLQQNFTTGSLTMLAPIASSIVSELVLYFNSTSLLLMMLALWLPSSHVIPFY